MGTTCFLLFLLDPIDCSKDLIFGYVSIASLSSAPITSIHVVINCLICVTLLYPQESKNAVIQRTAPSGSHQLAMDRHPNPKHPSPVPHHSVPQTVFVEIKCSFCILFRRSGRELWAKKLGVIRNLPITGIFASKDCTRFRTLCLFFLSVLESIALVSPLFLLGAPWQTLLANGTILC